MTMTTTGSSFFALTLVLCALMSGTALGRALDKRSADNAADPASDYPEQFVHEKPIQKRAALLLDRLLVALQKAVDNDEMSKDSFKTYMRPIPNYSDIPESHDMQLADERTMDLQRRGQAKGRVYWRCYLNAVTCFKRK